MSIAFLTRAYNAEPFLEQCVQSVLGQRNAELLYFLCNNGSTDGTAALIRSFAARDGRVRPPLPAGKRADRQHEPPALPRLCKRLPLPGPSWTPTTGSSRISRRKRKRCWSARAATSASAGTSVLRAARRAGPARACPRRSTWSAAGSAHGSHSSTSFCAPIGGKLWRISALARPSPLLVDASLFYGSDTIFALEGFCRCRRVVGEPGVLYHYRMHGASDSHRPLPDRFSDDLRQHSRTAALLAGNGWLSPGKQAVSGACLPERLRRHTAPSRCMSPIFPRS